MKDTVNEILKMYAGEYTDYELYLFKNPGHYCGNIHTDNVEYLADDVVIDYDKDYDINCQLMDEEDYNNTILANVNERFADLYEKNDKILVIIFPDAYVYNGVLYNREEWEELLCN